MSKKSFDDIPEEGHFRAADRGADLVSARVRAAFISAIRDAKDKIPAGPMGLALQYGDSSYASSLIRSLGIAQILEREITETGQKADDDSMMDEAILVGISLGAGVLGAEFSEAELARIRERASLYVSSELSSQLAEVDNQTALALALAILLVFGFRAPTAEAESASARTFQPDVILSLFGLNRIQVQGIIGRAQASIVAGVSPSIIRRTLLDEARVALVERAEWVASTVAERAINLAQQAAVEQAVESGLIGLETHVRQWVSRADGDVCPRCVDFHLVYARIDQPFRSRRGEVAWVPDIHPRGRCRFRIVPLAATEAA